MTKPKKYYIGTTVDECEMHMNLSVRGFDEKYGLKWSNKIRQTIKYYIKHKSEIKKNFKPTSRVYNLFFEFALNQNILSKVIYNGK